MNEFNIGLLMLGVLWLAGRYVAWRRLEARKQYRQKVDDAVEAVRVGVFTVFGSPAYEDCIKRGGGRVPKDDQPRLREAALYVARDEAAVHGTGLGLLTQARIDMLIEEAVAEFKARWVDGEIVADTFRARLFGVEDDSQ